MLLPHRKYPVIFIQNLDCNQSAHSVADRGWPSHPLISTTYRIFNPCIVYLRERTFTVYVYWSFQYGHWPTVTPTPSYSHPLSLAYYVLKYWMHNHVWSNLGPVKPVFTVMWGLMYLKWEPQISQITPCDANSQRVIKIRPHPKYYHLQLRCWWQYLPLWLWIY